MGDELRPFEIIDAMVRERTRWSDGDILDELNHLPSLADEGNACWDDAAYWNRVVYPYLALARLAAARRLRAAIRPLLDRACFGDPGETMRGLRHDLEAIVNPDWMALADVCMDAIKSDRPGTVLWAVDQLMVLDDPRSRFVLQRLVRSRHEEIAWRARAAIERLDHKQ
jgi:hypothetical protein